MQKVNLAHFVEFPLDFAMVRSASGISDLRELPDVWEDRSILLARIPGPLLAALPALRPADALDFCQYNNLVPLQQHADKFADPNRFAQLMDYNAPRANISYYFCLRKGSQPQLVGQVGFGHPGKFFDIDVMPWADDVAAVSTYVFPSARGQGNGALMLRAALAMGHEAGMPIIAAGTSWFNIASARSLRAGGMTELPAAPVSSIDVVSDREEIERRFISRADGQPAVEADWPYRPKHRGWLMK